MIKYPLVRARTTNAADPGPERQGDPQARSTAVHFRRRDAQQGIQGRWWDEDRARHDLRHRQLRRGRDAEAAVDAQADAEADGQADREAVAYAHRSAAATARSDAHRSAAATARSDAHRSADPGAGEDRQATPESLRLGANHAGTFG